MDAATGGSILSSVLIGIGIIVIGGTFATDPVIGIAGRLVTIESSIVRALPDTAEVLGTLVWNA